MTAVVLPAANLMVPAFVAGATGVAMAAYVQRHIKAKKTQREADAANLGEGRAVKA